MVLKLLTISRNTFQESIRQPILSVLILVAVLALVLNPSVAAYTLDDDNKLLIDLGLSTLLLSGLLLAAFTATGVLSDEIENRTVLTVISKPVGRPVFVIGKYLGVCGALTVAYWVLSMVFLLTVRHRVLQTVRDPFDGPVLFLGIGAAILALIAATLGNYFYRWVFTSTLVLALSVTMTLACGLVLLIGKDWQFQSIATEFGPDGAMLGGQMPIALTMVFQAVLILTAVAIAASTRLGQVMTLVVCALAFLLGLASDYLFSEFADRSVFIRAFCVASPNLQLLWPADALTQGVKISPGYLGLATGYTAMYCLAGLGVAVALFQRRQIS